MKLTDEFFEQAKPGQILASGELPNNIDGGLWMVNDYHDRLLKWIAVKGYTNDWAIYCDWADSTSEDRILRRGQKVSTELNIRKCVDCSDELIKKYRY
jgi:hypothetical protein